METLRKHKEILIILIFSTCAVLSAGLTSDLYLGDEVYHYRFAKDIFQAGKRVAFDPIYSTGNPPGYFYSSEPLWNGLLAILWRLVGNVSFPVAQIYHTIYYVFLIFLTYLLGIQIYGKKEGIYAALLISSIPMVVSFSILFYLDVPGTAFAALSLLLFLRRRFFLAGLGISLMYFTRRNGCFLVPGFILALLVFEKEKLLIRLKSLAFLILPTVILGFIDLRWRYSHIESLAPGAKEAETVDKTIKTLGYLLDYIIERMARFLWGSGDYLNSSLVSPKDIFMYFGITLLFGLFLYFYFRKGKKTELRILIYIIGYLVCYAYFFGISSDIRYLLPIVPLFCLLAASALKRVEHFKWVRLSIWVVCALQLLATSFYVHERRLMPQGIKEGFSFIKMNTPVQALFMYPGYIFIEATGRRFIWSSFFGVESRMMHKKYAIREPDLFKNTLMFWTEKEKDIQEIIKVNKIDYIVVNKSRIYDDAKVKHFGGYPKSFVVRLPKLPFMKMIFENQEMSIWEINGRWQPPCFRDGSNT